jgi:hypothetical protein
MNNTFDPFYLSLYLSLQFLQITLLFQQFVHLFCQLILSNRQGAILVGFRSLENFLLNDMLITLFRLWLLFLLFFTLLMLFLFLGRNCLNIMLSCHPTGFGSYLFLLLFLSLIFLLVYLARRLLVLILANIFILYLFCP